MTTTDKKLAARFFFRNCAVSIHLPGGLKISRTLKPGPNDVVLDRDFSPAGDTAEFLGMQSDFYKYLDATSPSTAKFVKKLAAIGYMLCNKLPRGGRRCRAFLCINAEDGACCNGKSLFAQAVAQMCIATAIAGREMCDLFWLDQVTSATSLLVIDDVPRNTKLQQLFALCTSDWRIDRRCLEPICIPIESAPYVLLTANMHPGEIRRDGSFRRRFVLLPFDSFYGPNNPIEKHIGRAMFRDWDSAQWHMFDNLMFYCVCEYLRSYSRGEDIFSLY